MGLADRAFDWEIQAAQLDCTDPDWTTTVNLLDIFKEIEISISAETMEADVAMDPSDGAGTAWRSPRIRSRDWAVRVSSVADNEASSEEAHNIFSLGHAASDGTITFSLLGPPSNGNSALNTHVTGVMTVGEGRLQYGGEAAEEELNLVGFTPPIVTID